MLWHNRVLVNASNKCLAFKVQLPSALNQETLSEHKNYGPMSGCLSSL